MPNEYLDKIKLNSTTYDIKDTISPRVTSVGLTNTGGLTITGSPITSSGTFSIGHANTSITAQGTQAVYPIKIDSYGHITSYGTAVTISTVYNGSLYTQKNSENPIALFTANQSTSTTLKWTTSDFKTVSSWSAGTLPTLGTAVSYTYVSSWVTNTPTVINTAKFSGGSFTRGTFTGGSLSMSGGGSTASEASTLIITFTAATHSADSFTAAALQTGFYTAGTSATLSYTNGSIQPLSSVGTLPSLVSSTSTLVTGITKL